MKRLLRAFLEGFGGGGRSDSIAQAAIEGGGASQDGMVEQQAILARRREATARSRAGDHAGAVAAIEQAQLVAGGVPAVPDDIRRAKYLQRDGRGAEAWDIYCRLFAASASAWDDVDLLDAMRLHLQRENEGKRAIAFGIAHRLARIALYRAMKLDAETAIAGPPPEHVQSIEHPELRGKSLWERMKDNHRNSIVTAETWIAELTDAADLEKFVQGLLKKAGNLDDLECWAAMLRRGIDEHISARDFLAQVLGEGAP